MLILALMAVVYSAPIGQPSMTSTAIAVDTSGNSYVAGYADQTGTRSFVNKLDSATGKVIWSAALQISPIKTIAVNGKGETYVGGSTSDAQGYLAKLSADGSKVLFSTSLGHTQTSVTALAVDPAGNIYVTGDTNDRSFARFVRTGAETARRQTKPQSTAQITALFENGSALVTPPFGGFPRLQTQYANATIAYAGGRRHASECSSTGTECERTAGRGLYIQVPRRVGARRRVCLCALIAKT